MKKLISLFLFLLPLVSLAQIPDANINTDINYVRTHGFDPPSVALPMQDLQNSKIGTIVLQATGTDTYIVSTFNANISAYLSGTTFPVYFQNGNTGAATLKLGTLATKTLVKNTSTALASGDIVSGGRLHWVYYDGTNFRISLGSTSGALIAANNLSDVANAATARTNLGAQATLVSGTNIKTINSASLLGSGNITISGGAGGGGYKVQSTAPSDTTAVWIDKGNAYVGMYPMKRYVSGSWQAISTQMDYYDPVGGIVSHGRPLCVLVWGQSNTATTFYLDYGFAGTGDVAKDNRISLWNADAAAWSIPDFSAQPTGGTTAQWSWSLNVGANNIQTFAKEFVKKSSGRAVRIVQWRQGATGLSYWEPGGSAPAAAGYAGLIAAATASGVPYFELIIGAHGEAGLVDGFQSPPHVSIYATYYESLYKGIMAGLRSQSFCDQYTAFIMPSHAQGQSVYPVGTTSDATEWAIRSLNNGDNPRNAWAQIGNKRHFQIANNGTLTTSSSSINLSTVTFPFTITVATGLPAWSATNPVVIISRSDPNSLIIGSVTAYNSGTGALTMGVCASNFWQFPGVYGTATLTDWDVTMQDYLHKSIRDHIEEGQAIYKSFANMDKDWRKAPAITSNQDKDYNVTDYTVQFPLNDKHRTFYARRTNTTVNIPFWSQQWITSIGGAGATSGLFAVGDGSTGSTAKLVFSSNNSGGVTDANAYSNASWWSDHTGTLFARPLRFTYNSFDDFSTQIKLANTSGIDIKLGSTGTRQLRVYDGTTLLTEINPTTGIFTNYLNKMVPVYNPALTFGYTFVGDAIAANRQITLPLLGGNDVMTTNAATQTLTNKTLTNPQINGAKFETSSTVGYIPTATGTDGSWTWQASTSGFSNPMTTAGDLILGGASGVAGRLAIGSNNTYLKSNGTTASWQAISAGALSSILAASGTNNIDNTSFTQTWQWNTLAGATGLALASSSTAAASNAQTLLSATLSGANATGSQTTIAGLIQNIHTGTGSVNVALQLSASGGTNNYALLVPNGFVGIGANPQSPLDVSLNTNGIHDVNIRNPNTGTSAAARLTFDNNGTTAQIGRFPSNYSFSAFQSSLVMREDVGDVVIYTNGDNFHFKQSGIFNAAGKIYVGSASTTPTALLMLKAGTATASTAPLKFTSGTNLTSPEAGAVEFDGTNYFATSSTTRYTLAKTLTNTATLDFGSTVAGAATDLTITVTGAADGDPVSVGVPNASTLSDGSFTAWVSATNTVTVRFTNNNLVSALDPASGTFRASVIHY